jgi:tellurium resistance protein TerD
MSVNLTKGAKLDLTKGNPGLTKLLVGLGWDVNGYSGDDFDLDAIVFLLGEDGKCASSADFIFFNNLKNSNESVVHTGDNLTGEGEGDDEVIKINLATLPTSVDKIVIAITVFNGEEKGQNLGQVSNAFIRVEDSDKSEELCRLDLSEDFSTETTVIAGEIYRHNGEFKFQATGAGYTGDLKKLCADYGVS